MNWRGDKTLPWTYIPFLMLAAIFIGEVLPVVIAIFGGVFDTYGAKEPIIKTLPDFSLVLIIYTLLGSFFWLLFKYISWQIVALFAIVLAFILEKWVYWHPEGEIGVTNTISFKTILGFIIIYFLVLVLPYLIFQAIRRKWQKRGIVISLAIILVLNVLGLGFTYYQMVKTGWFEKHQQNRSSSDPSMLPANICPDKLVEKNDQPTRAYLNGTEMQVSGDVQNWVRANCPSAFIWSGEAGQPGSNK